MVLFVARHVKYRELHPVEHEPIHGETHGGSQALARVVLKGTSFSGWGSQHDYDCLEGAADAPGEGRDIRGGASV